MSGVFVEAAKLEDLPPAGEAKLICDRRRNGTAFRGAAEEYPVAPRRTRTSLLPDAPSLPTFRGKVADGAFVLFLLIARFSFVIGAVVGGLLSGFLGVLIGLASGWIVGVWTRWSLGLRRRGLTHGFVVRMLERGDNDRPKLLESVVEMLRGHRLSAKQCRFIAAAYAEATRRLQTCESPADRAEILQERDRKVLAAAYGQGAHSVSATFADEPVAKRKNSLAIHRPGKRAVRTCFSGNSEHRR